MAKTSPKKIKNNGDGFTPYRTIEERSALGRALREQTPRSAHASWDLPKNRRDPVDILCESNADRIQELIPIRFGRMSHSPFAFYRGAAALMAADLSKTPTSGLRVQACGDAHLMNFGGFATPERNVVFDINDLDETLPAPFEWDLKRLAASVVIAARHIELPMSDASRVATEMAREYRERMTDYAGMRTLDVWYDKIDLRNYSNRLADPDVVRRVRKHMADRIDREERKSQPDFLYPKLVVHDGGTPKIKDEPPLIFHPSTEVAPGVETGYRAVIAAYKESLPEHIRTLFDRFHYFDLAMKVVGVGSVGTRCGIALFMAADNDPLFLQVKEARPSVLEPYAGKSLHANHGQRVVAGQRLMQTASDAFLGWTRGMNGRDFYIRQLRDLKLSAIIEDWDTEAMKHYAKMCAHALARAHARTGDAAMISGYMGTGRTFDDAIGEFAVEYAAQNRLDYRAFITAIREGRIQAHTEA
ncbi:DUF2252 domain-containing protein [Zwartia sp.]|uniref:DUF2252 domain-containing protein n=1 Tax=Zwartia sp. TaxID=2978004 RepID=UPI00271B51F6|nr:DUF2252 domain-containing protein [Zwartia sp.]MDO9023699.1 DUF2252 domain-containing protein [Zwartia sp.]